MLVDPILDKVKVAKIDHKSIFVQLVCLKGQGDRPAVPMQTGAPAVMVWLAVGEGNIPIAFTAGDHTGVESSYSVGSAILASAKASFLSTQVPHFPQ